MRAVAPIKLSSGLSRFHDPQPLLSAQCQESSLLCRNFLMVHEKCDYFPTHTVVRHPLVFNSSFNHQRHSRYIFISPKCGHHPSILMTWDSDPLLLSNYPRPIWILWPGTEMLVNPTLTVLFMEDITSLNTTVRFSLFCSKGRFKPGTPGLCQSSEYSYVKLVHLKQPSVPNV